jgi:hypothetical protein
MLSLCCVVLCGEGCTITTAVAVVMMSWCCCDDVVVLCAAVVVPYGEERTVTATKGKLAHGM